jgi:hypothetical protein
MIVGGFSKSPLAWPQQRIAAAGEPLFGTCSRAPIVLRSLSPFSHGRDIIRATRGDADASPDLRSERRSRPRLQRGRPRRLRCSGRMGVQRTHPLDQQTDELRRRTRRLERDRYLNQRRDGVQGMVLPRARPRLCEPPDTRLLSEKGGPRRPGCVGSTARPRIG